jgi:hypothetical protein
MKSRCNNKKSKTYERYGGLGIKVAPEWDDFAQFLKDVGPRPSLAYTLDRIDVLKDYEPGNVRWSTRKEQANNRRNTEFFEYNGQRLTMPQWAEVTGLPCRTLRMRLRYGWSIERILTTPLAPWAGTKY